MTSQRPRRRITRALLKRLPSKLLHKGAGYKPDLHIYEVDGEKLVLKDYSGKAWVWRVLVGRLSIRQEIQALKALDGVEGVPAFRGQPDADSLAMSFASARPATPPDPMVRGNRAFFDEIERIVAKMHRRGVVHLDFKHRSNLLVSDDCRPVLIDFASAFCFRQSWFGGRFLLALFKPIDLMALQHWKKRLCPGALSEDDLQTARARAVARKFWWPRWVLDRVHSLIEKMK